MSDPDTPDIGSDLTLPGFNATASGVDTDTHVFTATMWTNDLAQVRYRSNVNSTLDVATTGWADTRGRLS